MTFVEIIQNACEQPTLVKALSYAAICENDRAVKQAMENYGSGANGAGWDTCFEFLFKELLREYKGPSGV